VKRRSRRAGLLLAFALVTGLEAASTGISLVDAVKLGNREAVRALLARRTDVNQPEPDGTTALH